MFLSTKTILLCAAFSGANGFGVQQAPVKSRFGVSSRSRTGGVLFAVSVAQRYFQLEELEDAETSTTEVFLNADRTVVVGETDGPLFMKGEGTWIQKGSVFEMILTRRFQAGREGMVWTDMGEFEFDVVRTFTGELTMVGAAAAVEGGIHCADEILGDQEVGFFNMIDTTTERLAQDKEAL